MLEQIRAFLSGLRGDEKSSVPDASDPDVAAVALFYHVIGADGVIDEAEAQTLKKMIAEEYAGSASSVGDLLAAGEAADRESVDLYAFTSVLNRSLDLEGKTHLSNCCGGWPMPTDIGMNWRTMWSGGSPI
jgi:uncharacterized tellurite resistance protein B-like protein